MKECNADKTFVHLNLGDSKEEAGENNIEKKKKNLTEKGLLKRVKKTSFGRTVTDFGWTLKESIRYLMTILSQIKSFRKINPSLLSLKKLSLKIKINK